MRLVVLTGTGVEHEYVVSRLAAEFASELAAVIVARKPPLPAGARIRSLLRRYSLPQLVSRAHVKVHGRLIGRARKRDATYRRLLLPAGGGPRAELNALFHSVPTINGVECQALLREIDPDVIAVYGTALIRPAIMRLARRGALNMHTGLSPRYRGSDTVFWPLHNEEPEWIGVTVHMLDEGIDSGPVLATGRPKIEPEDDEDSLFAKCVRLGTELYAQAIRDVSAGNVRPLTQDLQSGREYRFVDRTVAAERRVARLLAGGLLRQVGERKEPGP